jgi:uncharacterized protein YjiS (DUF1127 family)
MASHPLNAAAWPESRHTVSPRAVLLAVFWMWQAARTRRELARLDAHLLRDIGLTAGEAARETARAPWDLR